MFLTVSTTCKHLPYWEYNRAFFCSDLIPVHFADRRGKSSHKQRKLLNKNKPSLGWCSRLLHKLTATDVLIWIFWPNHCNWFVPCSDVSETRPSNTHCMNYLSNQSSTGSARHTETPCSLLHVSIKLAVYCSTGAKLLTERNYTTPN